MKRYLKDYVLTTNKIEEAIYDCLKRKWKRKDVAYFLASYMTKEGEDIHEVAKYCLKFARYKETRHIFAGIITKISYSLYEEIETRSIILKPIRYELKYDSTSMKIREIGISSIKQQIYDYIAVNACKPMFMAKIGFYQCASLEGRGQVYGKRALEKWIRKDPINTRYYYKWDIKKYYPSVSKRKLKRLLHRDIKDLDILYVIDTLLNTYKSGLCIGSYLSQYLANYYLSYIYHYMTENSYSIRTRKNGDTVRVNNVKHILLYMDDIIMFSSSIKLLNRAADDFKKCLTEYELQLKKDTKIQRTKVSPIDMMGYVVSITKTIIRKRVYSKIFRLFLRLKRRTERLSLHISRRILSYNGYLKHSNLYLFKQRYDVTSYILKAKKVVKYYDKRKFYNETRYVQLLHACGRDSRCFC